MASALQVKARHCGIGEQGRSRTSKAREYGDAKRAEGKAEAILTVLAARGLAVDSETRARIEACSDAATLNRWIARAATAASAVDVIANH